MDRLARLVAVVLEPVRATVDELRRGLRQARAEVAVEVVRLDGTRQDLRAAARMADLTLRDLEDLRD
ncbi:MAG: hypothetical protein KF878_08925 [Planctomycetes bacterium]|nr:hypothetical protein [Planctomycetota bacterium]MCW8137973.1 hypothetical protein [Planctomycetota bacterium]